MGGRDFSHFRSTKMKYVLFAALASFLLSKLDNVKPKENIDEEYDFVIVGSGPAGCALANRLSENVNIKVLLVEAGETDTAEPRISIPAETFSLEGSSVDWKYEGVSNNYITIKNKTHPIPRGKVLGGTSSINGQMYNRGSPHDYNRWEDLGAEGWGWKDVEPYFKRIEQATMKGMSERLGKHGPLKLVSNSDNQSPKFKTFYDAAEEIGIKKTDYITDMEGISLVTLSVHNGIRQNAVTAYLRPIFPERKDRLDIVIGAQATKILTSIQDSGKPKAYGVRYRKNGKLAEVRARKEVILCAGFIGSAQLLLLSGIGPKKQLQNLDIDVVANLPGVGENLQDHLYYRNSFNISKPFKKPETENTAFQYIVHGQGKTPSYLVLHYRTSLSGNDTSVSSRKRPTAEIQMYLGNFLPQPGGSKFLIMINLMQVKSKGTLRLRSQNADDHPLIDLNFYENDDDFMVYLEGFRLMEKLENSKAFKDIGANLMLPNICNGLKNTKIPRSKEFYRCLLENNGVSGAHQCCTAKIGRKGDKYAVVDPQLRVYGVSNLRVADASVMPHITSGNTQAPCYMIGEKAADMIRNSWNLA